MDLGSIVLLFAIVTSFLLVVLFYLEDRHQRRLIRKARILAKILNEDREVIPLPGNETPEFRQKYNSRIKAKLAIAANVVINNRERLKEGTINYLSVLQSEKEFNDYVKLARLYGFPVPPNPDDYFK